MTGELVLPGQLSASEVAATAASILDQQQPSGAIRWAEGQHADLWNHTEAAMALTAAGRVEAAEFAYRWAFDQQRHDGSMPMRIQDDAIEDASAETNMTAYLAVGIWHHWLIQRDEKFVREAWPSVRAGLDYVAGAQLPFGGIAWSQEWSGEPRQPAKLNAEALLAGSSSIYQSLRAGVALADLVGDPQPEWELAGGRLGHAIRIHRDQFMDKSTYSMDWYYPILGGAVRGAQASELLQTRWADFVVPGVGVRCVDTNPWVTAAETAELVMTLDLIGQRDKALALFTDIQRLRDSSGAYWTGYVYDKEVFWPGEHTTYTAAAVLLAADALSLSTPGATIMRGTKLAPHFAEIGLECGCLPHPAG